MRLLVFGRSGQLAQALQQMPGVTALGRDQADLTAPEACAAIIRAAPADAVINAAAYTAVDLAEREEALATAINGTAVTAMARAAADRGLPFLQVSSDYVFDGSGTAAWRPDDAPAPLNAYGRSKLAGERGVQAAGGAHAILRTSWVFSADGTNFVKTMLRLGSERINLRVVGDQIGGPTPAADLAATLRVMAQALCDGHRSGIWHYAGAPATSWAGLAREAFAQAGMPVTVDEIATADWPTPARRPLNSRLDCATTLTDFGIAPPNWVAGLAQVLTALERKRG